MPDEEGPDHFAESARAYRAERERNRHRGSERTIFEKMRADDEAKASREHKAKSGGNGKYQPRFLPVIEPAWQLADEPVPTREFIDSRSLMPIRNVILLSGDGGMGKSLLALQLALACTTGTQWLGMDVAQGPVLYLSAEDDIAEMHIRLDAICRAEGLTIKDTHLLKLLPMAGEDMTLAVEGKDHQLAVTHLYQDLDYTVAEMAPLVVMLDNQADVYGANESNRAQVKHFVGMLRKLCLKHDTTVLLLGHPSVAGRSSGTGESGSTAWNNSVRARMYLHKPEGADADEEGNRRILEVMKANYSKAGVRLEIKWAHHRFVVDEVASPFQRITAADVDKVRQAFATGQWRVNEQADDWGGYAVADILDFDVGRGISAGNRNILQNRNRDHIKTFLATWLRNGAIHIVIGANVARRPTKFYSDRAPKKEDNP